jgi:Icc-related predicted phosphoesterase
MTLRLHLYSDLHGDQAACREIVRRAALADVVVIAGDIGNLRVDLEGPIEVMRAIQTPVVLVPGNSESDEQLRELCTGWDSAVVLHGGGTTISGLIYYGLGGGIPPTPFGPWSWDFSEREADLLLADCPPGCILVTHSPPWGALDESSPGRHLGSRAIRAAVERLTPRLVVCGHIHSNAGRHALIGSTPVVNAGPKGVEWELDA